MIVTNLCNMRIQIHEANPDNIEALQYLEAICKDIGRPHYEYSNRLDKLRRLQNPNPNAALTRANGPGSVSGAPSPQRPLPASASQMPPQRSERPGQQQQPPERSARPERGAPSVNDSLPSANQYVPDSLSNARYSNCVIVSY